MRDSLPNSPLKEAPVSTSHEPDFKRAKLFRRLSAIIYDSFLMAAIWMLIGFIVLRLFGLEQSNTVVDGKIIQNPVVSNILLLCMIVSYFSFFSWFWMKNGQTLGMQAWRIKLESNAIGKLTLKQCMIRLVISPLSLACLGLGYIWLYFDKNNDAIHDKISKTKIVFIPKIK